MGEVWGRMTAIGMDVTTGVTAGRSRGDSADGDSDDNVTCDSDGDGGSMDKGIIRL